MILNYIIYYTVLNARDLYLLFITQNKIYVKAVLQITIHRSFCLLVRNKVPIYMYPIINENNTFCKDIIEKISMSSVLMCILLNLFYLR